MRKYITTLLVLTAIVVIAFSFKISNNKIGPRLLYRLNETGNDNFVVWVYLTDKGPDAQQLLSNPLNLVTQRSIDRRLKVKSPENVVDMTDVQVYQPYVSEIMSKVVRVRAQARWFNCISVEATRQQIDDISELSYVSKIELVERYVRVKDGVEADITGEGTNPGRDEVLLDTLNYGTGNANIQITQIKVNLVHNQGIYGQGVLVASFDAGFSNLTHEVFTTLPMKINSTWDFHTGSPNLTGNSHGTATLSLVGGYKPTKLVGPAFGSSFLLARTEVTSFERPIEMDYWAAAVEWADSLGADVITSSLGYLTFDPGYPSYTWQAMNGDSLVVTIAADLAVNKGIVVSNSAGNSGYNSSHNTLIGPADGDSVITVGAVTSTGTRSSFSSVGPTTDNPPRIKPDVAAMGSSNYVAGTSGNSYYNGSGTSFSCPLNSGVCALILSANKSLTPIQVRGILRKFASQSNNPDNLIGWGIIDAQQSVDSARKLDNTPPVITHTQPFTNTYSNANVIVKTKITDNGIIRRWVNESPRCYYRKSTNGGINWTSYSFLDYSYYNNIDSFFFSIPGSPAGTRVEYYFAAQDIALPTPKMSTLPAGGSGVNPPGTTPPPTRFVYNVLFVGVSGNNGELPREFKLYDNYPNPFNPTTKIRFDIPLSRGVDVPNSRDGRGVFVSLKVYDILGREVYRLIDGELKAGRYELEFDAANLPSGVYFYKLVTDSFTDTKKMLLVK